MGVKLFSWNRLQAIVILIIGLIWLNAFYSIGRWKTERVIKDDVISYYAYLPAAFIYGDLQFNFLENIDPQIKDRIWVRTTPDGKRVLKMTMGLAILFLPFFAIGHLIALGYGIATGYSVPYELLLSIGACVYGILGLVFLKKTLSSFFSEKSTIISIVCIALGTNLFYYTAYEGGMSHVYSFFLFSAFIFYSIQWNQETSTKNSMILGLLLGLITLVRPTNIIICIIPALYGVNGLKDLKNKIRIHLGQIKQLVSLGICFCLVLIPQFIYWKYSVGSWYHYSYTNEAFYFLDPHVIDGLFSFRKGWLVYSPIMVFSILGLLTCRKYCPELLIPILVYFPLNLYVIFSWWCWWYGGSFGCRPLIESYALLSIPFAGLVNTVLENKPKVLGYLVGTLMIAMIWLNFFQTKQYSIALIHWDSMTRQAYWSIFCTMDRPENLDQLLQKPDYEMAMMGLEER